MHAPQASQSHLAYGAIILVQCHKVRLLKKGAVHTGHGNALGETKKVPYRAKFWQGKILANVW